ncbi:adenylosuccinate synthase [Pontiella sulfatireligans]|uniref:Adenylosuccinate synthetase n=1 Tax=Pontiella sulfatireligans TaxID=2750658 RepID=A0A6C2URK8_9BACT|nr:adenylosuccinate synthase [Pontiella sulfatireligans]VGO22769.1 Adenylosuccinate synthetase [Pontiella sulfatireligans]
MSKTVLIGSQWGDEGKGKIIDVLTANADWVVRYQGGNNAGHTVEIGDQKYVLHLTPSGILRESCKCVIGNGLVVDLVGLVSELTALVERGIKLDGRLFISDRAHIVLQYHKEIDGAKEGNLEEGKKIGTTKRGIGPAYIDKADRTGLRMGDILEADFFDMVKENATIKNAILVDMGAQPLDIDELLGQVKEATDYLRPFICDTIPLLHEAVQNDDEILFEGAQGVMLDVDFGSYPFVTSSNTGAGGAPSGSGVPPNAIDRVVGIVKAYTTRVGEGPFPTELHDDMGAHIAQVGHEFGATTGRPRRCGWFDGVVAHYAAMVGGINEWALMKLDVLDDVETIKVCVAYEVDGERITSVPASIRKLERCKPIYEDFKGWNTPTTECTTWEELPEQAQKYVEYLEKLTGVKVSILSVGPKRSSTLLLDR